MKNLKFVASNGELVESRDLACVIINNHGILEYNLRRMFVNWNKTLKFLEDTDFEKDKELFPIIQTSGCEVSADAAEYIFHTKYTPIDAARIYVKVIIKTYLMILERNNSSDWITAELLKTESKILIDEIVKNY